MTSLLHGDADARVVPDWELCDRLTRSLRLLNMSQQEVADLLGVRRETVSRWINGKNTPSRAWLIVWADMTGVRLDWLETGHVDMLRARRDSNPKPSDSEPRGRWGRPVRRRHLALVSGVNMGFTPNRLVAVS